MKVKGMALVLVFAALRAMAIPSLVPFPQEYVEAEGTVIIKSTSAIKFVTDAKLPPSGYTLRIVKGKAPTIASSDAAGKFYAKQTLKQLGKKTSKGLELPCCTIRDYPAFPWRGVMLDECRHFFGKEAVKRLLDAMAQHKMNVFHWHLTEDQAWRLAVPKYPELLKYGAVRPRSAHPDGLGLKGIDERRYGPFFYTEADVKEIVAYAKARHIRVIPEIEIPGHALAAIAAYPELCCRGKLEPRAPWASWGISQDIFCAGNDETIKFLEHVLDYVAKVFPDPVIHIGGDEAPKARWKECAKCQSRIAANNLANEEDLQRWMTQHFTEYLAKKGKRVICWDEALSKKLPKETMLMFWRSGCRGKVEAIKDGHSIVMTPSDYYYPAQLQCAPEIYKAKGYGYPGWSRIRTLEHVYSFNPLADVPRELHKSVLGVQSSLWTENTLVFDEAEWKLWPRTAVVAETGWTGPQKRGFSDFKARVRVDMERMKKQGYNVKEIEEE